MVEWSEAEDKIVLALVGKILDGEISFISAYEKYGYKFINKSKTEVEERLSVACAAYEEIEAAEHSGHQDCTFTHYIPEPLFSILSNAFKTFKFTNAKKPFEPEPEESKRISDSDSIYETMSLKEFIAYRKSQPKQVFVAYDESATPNFNVSQTSNLSYVGMKANVVTIPDSFLTTLFRFRDAHTKRVSVRGKETDVVWTDVDVYTNSKIDRKNYNKIIDPFKRVRPTLNVIYRLCFGLKLNYDQAIKLIASAGYILQSNYDEDYIVEYALRKNMNLDEVNDLLEKNECLPLIPTPKMLGYTMPNKYIEKAIDVADDINGYFYYCGDKPRKKDTIYLFSEETGEVRAQADLDAASVITQEEYTKHVPSSERVKSKNYYKYTLSNIIEVFIDEEIESEDKLTLEDTQEKIKSKKWFEVPAWMIDLIEEY